MHEAAEILGYVFAPEILGFDLYPITEDFFSNTSINNDVSMSLENTIALVDSSAGEIEVSIPDCTGFDNVIYIFKCVDLTNPIRITALGACLIDGATFVDFSAQWQTINMISLNGNWYLI